MIYRMKFLQFVFFFFWRVFFHSLPEWKINIIFSDMPSQIGLVENRKTDNNKNKKKRKEIKYTFRLYFFFLFSTSLLYTNLMKTFALWQASFTWSYEISCLVFSVFSVFCFFFLVLCVCASYYLFDYNSFLPLAYIPLYNQLVYKIANTQTVNRILKSSKTYTQNIWWNFHFFPSLSRFSAILTVVFSLFFFSRAYHFRLNVRIVAKFFLFRFVVFVFFFLFVQCFSACGAWYAFVHFANNKFFSFWFVRSIFSSSHSSVLSARLLNMSQYVWRQKGKKQKKKLYSKT